MLIFMHTNATVSPKVKLTFDGDGMNKKFLVFNEKILD